MDYDTVVSGYFKSRCNGCWHSANKGEAEARIVWRWYEQAKLSTHYKFVLDPFFVRVTPSRCIVPVHKKAKKAKKKKKKKERGKKKKKKECSLERTDWDQAKFQVWCRP